MNINTKMIAMILTIAILFTGIGLYACDSDSRNSTGFDEVHTIEVSRGTLRTTLGAFGSISLPQQASLTFGSSGNIVEINVQFGDSVKKGDMLATLDTSSLERGVSRAEADLRVAEIGLEQTSSDVSMASAEAFVDSANSTLIAAWDALEDAQIPYTDTEIANAEAAVRNARLDLENAKKSLANTEKSNTISITDAEEAVNDALDAYNDYVHEHILNLEIITVAAQRDDLWWAYEKALENLDIAEASAASSNDTAQNNILKAEEALINAEEDLADMTPDSIIIQQKESAVATAEASLTEAMKSLENVKEGLDVELKQIAVNKAQIVLDDARDSLADASIVAPFDGIVANIDVKVGDLVTASTEIIKLVNVDVVEVDAEVDEIDVANVRVGQSAEISVDALPRARLTGKVSAVSPIGKNQSGLVTYDLTIGINKTEGINLKEGMTASVDIEAILAANAVVVPNVAIQKVSTADVSMVGVVLENGETEQRMVEAGATDGMLTEIISGLSEGEKIVSAMDVELPGDIMECIDHVMNDPCVKKLMKLAEDAGFDMTQGMGGLPGGFGGGGR